MTTEALATVETEPRVELGIVHGETPALLVKHATAAADALAEVIRSRELYSNISGKRFVKCEGWTTLAAMMGVTPHEVTVTEVEGTFTATVELRRLTDGQVIGRASAECGMDEPLWAKRSRNARRSMALTRATAKACRLAFSWVMALSGFEVTPAEEMDRSEQTTAHTADGEVLDPATDADRLQVLREAAAAGVTKETFPSWYAETLKRPWKDQIYEQDVKPLLAAAAARIATRKKEKAPATA